jgi:hypothetical protein
VALANLERTYYEIWKGKDTPADEAEKAEMMTWASSWEIEEIVRKFKNRRRGDQWGMVDFALARPLPSDIPPRGPQIIPPSTTSATRFDASTNNQQQPSARTASVQPPTAGIDAQAEAEQHPVYGLFFKMLRNGIPRPAVEQKMRLLKFDPKLLDAPGNLPLYADVISPPVNMMGTETVVLRPVAARNQDAQATLNPNPYASALHNMLANHPLFKHIREVSQVEEDDADAPSDFNE